MIKANSHLVTVDVVVTDHHGSPVPGLTANDFQVFEIPYGKKQHEEKISQFEYVTQSPVDASKPAKAPQLPAGVYMNLLTTRKLPVPPTVLLVDGLNTDIDTNMLVRRQMVKMLSQIPSDTPVAVFLLGRQLTLLQGFTKDPSLLKAAAQRALSLDSAAGGGDARDDASSLSQQAEDMFGGQAAEESPQVTGVVSNNAAPAAAPSSLPGGELQIAAIERFERETFAAATEMRVQLTLDGLRAIARHLSGYGGRKNLIWISSSFPLTLQPDATQQHNLGFVGLENYESQMVSVTNALADAKVAVYPVNPAGVQTQKFFDVANTRPTSTWGIAPNQQKNSINRENQARFASQESMQEVAEQTGGKICVNNNDLADCVKIAVAEGSSYYEIAYHPDASNWHGEFHKIIIKSERPGLQLSFRQGYFARTSEEAGKEREKNGNDSQLEEAACGDLLTATSLLVVARAYPPDQPGQVKYFMVIDSKRLSLLPTDAGNHSMSLDVAVCSMDNNRKPVQFMQDHVRQEITDKDLPTITARGITHVIQFTPKPETASVRLVVRDVESGRLGSLDIPYPPALPPAVKSSVAPPPPPK